MWRTHATRFATLAISAMEEFAEIYAMRAPDMELQAHFDW